MDPNTLPNLESVWRVKHVKTGQFYRTSSASTGWTNDVRRAKTYGRPPGLGTIYFSGKQCKSYPPGTFEVIEYYIVPRSFFDETPELPKGTPKAPTVIPIENDHGINSYIEYKKLGY